MFNNMNSLFTIGQFAAIHNINKKTLMWYDQVDLLKPALVKDNGYRYYSYYQSAKLETILMLRQLDVPIKEIKMFLDNRSAKTMEKLLSEKIEDINLKIDKLNEIKDSLTRSHKNMQTILNLDFSTIEIVNLPPKKIVLVPTSSNANTETEIKAILNIAKTSKLSRLHDGIYGTVLLAEDLLNGNFTNYQNLFLELPDNKNHKDAIVKPGGTYIRSYCKGDWNGIPNVYKKMLDFAKKHNFVITGYAYETGINEDVIKDFDDYITQIEISVKSE